MKKIAICYTGAFLLSLGLAGCGGTLEDGSAQDNSFDPDATKPHGVDVSGWQGSVNWGAVAGAGQAFAYVKATEGTGYISPDFSAQYDGSYRANLIRGAYHFAIPNASSGAAQANYFIDHGGGWSADGKTLPGALDIEYNPYGSTCYGLSGSSMVSWIHSFINQYKARTGRDAVIYTTADWWNTCTGHSTAFGATNPLWVANYGVSKPALPAGWSVYTFWQYTSTASVPGISGHSDVSVFNGSHDRLVVLARNK